MGQTKKEIRQTVKSRLSNLTEQYKKTGAEAITEKVQAELSGQEILLYSAIQDEVNTSSLIQFVIDAFGHCYLPKVDPLGLKAYKVCDLNGQLSMGAYGVLEPNEKAKPVDSKRISTIVVPGLAFDRACNRMGRGKGYYDRFLMDLDCQFIGLAFDEQVIENLIVDDHDIKMHRLITPQHIYRAEKE